MYWTVVLGRYAIAHGPSCQCPRRRATSHSNLSAFFCTFVHAFWEHAVEKERERARGKTEESERMCGDFVLLQRGRCSRRRPSLARRPPSLASRSLPSFPRHFLACFCHSLLSFSSCLQSRRHTFLVSSFTMASSLALVTLMKTNSHRLLLF